MEIRILREADAGAFYQLRLQALEREPQAFGESAAEHRGTPLAATIARLHDSSPEGSFVAGAFADGQLVGVAGFLRYQTEKTRHKGRIWGVYVAEGWRRQGVARRVLAELLRLARAQPGLEHITLTAGASQTAARSLYLSLGFEIYGHEPRALKIGAGYVDEDYMLLRVKE